MNRQNIKKLYYSISEISDMLDIKQSVIRYWESEFKELKPQKNRAGNRIYKKEDIATIRLIRYYMHEKHLSIQETKEMIRHLKAEDLYKRKIDELMPPEPDNDLMSDDEETPETDTDQTPGEERAEEEEDNTEEPQIIPEEDDDILFPVEDIPEIVRKELPPEDLEENAEEKTAEALPSAAIPEVEAKEVSPENIKEQEEIRELLKKISSNICDIIMILNENK